MVFVEQEGSLQDEPKASVLQGADPSDLLAQIRALESLGPPPSEREAWASKPVEHRSWNAPVTTSTVPNNESLRLYLDYKETRSPDKLLSRITGGAAGQTPSLPASAAPLALLPEGASSVPNDAGTVTVFGESVEGGVARKGSKADGSGRGAGSESAGVDSRKPSSGSTVSAKRGSGSTGVEDLECALARYRAQLLGAVKDE